MGKTKQIRKETRAYRLKENPHFLTCEKYWNLLVDFHDDISRIPKGHRYRQEKNGHRCLNGQTEVISIDGE